MFYYFLNSELHSPLRKTSAEEQKKLELGELLWQKLAFEWMEWRRFFSEKVHIPRNFTSKCFQFQLKLGHKTKIWVNRTPPTTLFATILLLVMQEMTKFRRKGAGNAGSWLWTSTTFIDLKGRFPKKATHTSRCGVKVQWETLVSLGVTTNFR